MSTITATLAKPPWVGLLAFIIVFVVQALGHTVMILMEDILGHEYVYHSATFMGIVGAVLLWWGMRHPGEVAGTWLGFWAGTLLWTGWVEFSFVWNAAWLEVPDLMDPAYPGEPATKAEYLVMMSSLGVMMATLAYFTLNPETRCNFFVWLQRHLKMRVGKPTRGLKRNFAAITALETIYVIWFFYLVLLFLYEFVGEKHPVTYALFFMNTAWAVYLLNRLVRFWKVTTAIRYGIPTGIVAWNSVELIGRWHLITEFWEKPQEFALEMSLITGAVIVGAILAVRAPGHQKAVLAGDAAEPEAG